MLFFLFAFIFLAFGLVAIVALGPPLLTWMYIGIFGFRPTGFELSLCFFLT